MDHLICGLQYDGKRDGKEREKEKTEEGRTGKKVR